MGYATILLQPTGQMLVNVFLWLKHPFDPQHTPPPIFQTAGVSIYKEPFKYTTELGKFIYI